MEIAQARKRANHAVWIGSEAIHIWHKKRCLRRTGRVSPRRASSLCAQISRDLGRGVSKGLPITVDQRPWRPPENAYERYPGGHTRRHHLDRNQGPTGFLSDVRERRPYLKYLELPFLWTSFSHNKDCASLTENASFAYGYVRSPKTHNFTYAKKQKRYASEAEIDLAQPSELRRDLDEHAT